MSILQAIDYCLGGGKNDVCGRSHGHGALDNDPNPEEPTPKEKLEAALVRHKRAVADTIESSSQLGLSLKALNASNEKACEYIRQQCPRDRAKCPYGKNCPERESCPYDHSEDDLP